MKMWCKGLRRSWMTRSANSAIWTTTNLRTPSPREIAVTYTDRYQYFVSESTVYRILKAYDLVTSPAFQMITAADRLRNRPERSTSYGKPILPNSRLSVGVGITSAPFSMIIPATFSPGGCRRIWPPAMYKKPCRWH